MSFDFDVLVDRRGSGSTKWQKFPPEVLPMWVADMDFAAPGFVLEAISERLRHPILGYSDRPASLDEAFQAWLQGCFGWQVPEEWLVWIPGVVPGLNLACRTQSGARSGLMIPTPVYHPFLDLAANAGLSEQRVPMEPVDGKWEMDIERMQAHCVADTSMVLICNPHNPTGRAYTPDELEALAEFVERNDLLLVVDEIHCNILLKQGVQHHPIAHICPDIAERTVTLYSVTKIYNIPGVSCAVAVVPDPVLRERFKDVRSGLLPGIGPLGFTAAEAAFRDETTWVSDLVTYLRGNYAELVKSMGDRLSVLEATYLAWVDVRDLELTDAEAHFVAHGIGISPGSQFDGDGHIRLNFGCPRQTLLEGLERLSSGIDAALK